MNDIVRKVYEAEENARKVIETARQEISTAQHRNDQKIAAMLTEARQEANSIIQQAMADAREDAERYREAQVAGARKEAEEFLTGDSVAGSRVVSQITAVILSGPPQR